MTSTKFAGLGDVKRLGLSVSEATNRLLILAFAEKHLMFFCAAKMVSVPERDLKLLLSRLQYNAASRCHFLRNRLRELRTTKVRIDGVPAKALEIFFDEALFSDQSQEITEIARWILQQLLSSYEEYLQKTNPLADAPSCELIESYLIRLGDSIAGLDLYRARFGISDSERNLPVWLRKFAAAPGKFDGSTLERDVLPRERSISPFTVSRVAGYDESLSRVWDYVKPPIENVAEHFNYMLGIRLSEINVAEGLAVVLCETKDRPWEFYWDISRHLWDEARHSMMGEAAIEATYGAATAIPMREYESVYCMEAPALEQYATLGLEIEGAQMRYPVGKRGEWEFCRDAAKHPLMTTFQDYDWADEVLHVALAKRQLGQWSNSGITELNALAAEGKSNRTKVKERHLPVRIVIGEEKSTADNDRA
jgi:hypothetical protein